MVKQKEKKLRVGVHSLTGCAGCQLSIYFIEDILLDLLDKIELIAAPMIKGANIDGPYDILFVEGSVSSQGDLENLKKWREEAKILVSLGACATHGCMQSMKHMMDEKQVEQTVYNKFPSEKNLQPITAVPLHNYIDVEFLIPGCPPSKDEIVQILKHVLQGRILRVYDKAVCHACSLKENYCLLDQGIECLGPLCNGGCQALCPSFNHPCTGCRGWLDDANIGSGKKLLEEKGFNIDMLVKRMTKYNALQFLEHEKKAKEK
ncbi:MAG: hypothetical protein KJ685_01435 [Nanoarchaeota archaeon]|nr:hypothetical protein [Nanoarchaeota archaeon]MBU2441100.1 hypothetical protein [Nanoarchaeota archaeon]